MRNWENKSEGITVIFENCRLAFAGFQFGMSEPLLRTHHDYSTVDPMWVPHTPAPLDIRLVPLQALWSLDTIDHDEHFWRRQVQLFRSRSSLSLSLLFGFDSPYSVLVVLRPISWSPFIIGD